MRRALVAGVVLACAAAPARGARADDEIVTEAHGTPRDEVGDGSDAARDAAGSHDVGDAPDIDDDARAPTKRRRERILQEGGDEGPDGVRAPGKPAFCWSCVFVGAGTAAVIGAIPLAVLATSVSARQDGVDYGNALLDCDAASTGVCASLRGVNTNATPYAVAAGVVGGVGVALITTGIVFAYAVPARDGGGVALTLAPRGTTGATLTVRASF
ncbi:MAG TPA: hypothetical protein VL400_27215 [Polyangiaceae bacterium]|nr:hypothetical protein [Polyangiaceae bacterium]